MLRFQQGDRAAFEELVRRNANKVHALIYRFLGEAELVEDLTQEVFLRIFRTAPRYQPAAKFSTWLYRIVANLSFNVMRDRRKAHQVLLDSPFDADDTHRRDVPDPHAPPPQRDLDQAELAGRVAQAVNELPENQKIAIVLNKFEQKNYEEIAAVLGCSTMAVKSLLSRARANLRGAMRRYVSPD